MRLRTDHKKIMGAGLIIALLIPLNGFAQVAETNPSQYLAIGEGTARVNSKIESQTNGMKETATVQGTIAAEFTQMKKWEGQYNSYLKKARGYAETLKAATTLYADALTTLRHLYELKKAIGVNPQGIGATLSMNDLYSETVAEFVETFRILNECISKGGSENMLTGAERTEMLWQLSDEMARLNHKLHRLAISIAYHNFKDVWNRATAGMVDKGHGEIASDAIERWQRASQLNKKLNE